MRDMIQKMMLGAIVLLLTACGSSPKVTYYTLESPAMQENASLGEQVTLALGPLRIPEYLNRSQIVTRGPGSELQVDEYNRWAEPLKVSVHRVVAADVDNLLESVTAIAFPHASTVQSDIDYRLVGDIYRFDASHSGQVVLETQWAIASAGGELVMPPRRTRYEAPASASADPGAMVASMNDVLAQFSRDIAEAMQDLLQKED